MNPAVRFASLLALTLLTLPARAQTWIEVRSPHFSVVTDAGERRGREVALQFEQMRAVFGAQLQRQRVSIPVPVQVIAVRDNKGMRLFLPWFKGKPTEAMGIYLASEARNFILLDLSFDGRWRTVFYGFAHLLLDANYPPAQTWFDEGFAEYFSTIRVSNKQVRIGAPPEGLVEILKDNKLWPVTELFRVGPALLRETGDSRTLFSAQSWLLVHYLMDLKKLKETGDYFDLVQNQGVPLEQAIPRAFGVEAAEFDRQLDAYRRSQSAKQVTSEAPPGLDSGGYQVATLADADHRTLLAELHLSSPDYKEQAPREFEEVLALKPDHAAAHRGLGYAYLRKGQFDKAGEHFRRAAELDPKDARALYYSALYRTMSGKGDSDAAFEIKDQLHRALSIQPDLAEAHALLATVHLRTQDAGAALTSIKSAVRLSPRHPGYRLSLGQIYISAQLWDEAEAVFQGLLQNGDPQLASVARDALQKIPGYRSHPPSPMTRLVRPPDTSAYESPKWKRKKDSTPPEQPATEGAAPATAETTAETTPAHETRKIEFLRGRLLSVECDTPGAAATVSITAADKTWKMRVRDRGSLILINADQFSCSWSGQDVGVNYRAGGAADGDLVSLEIRILTQEPVRLKKKN